MLLSRGCKEVETGAESLVMMLSHGKSCSALLLLLSAILISGEKLKEQEPTAEKAKPAVNDDRYLMNELDASWPATSLRQAFGQIGGLAQDANGNAFIFHRAERLWDSDDFNEKYSYVRAKYGPIRSNTIVILDKDSNVRMAFGKNMFYLPHGISLDHQGNVWVTDVALHQILKFELGKTKPTFTLGQNLIPGHDDKHFCQPTSVAVARTGDIFVADGYCNSRIMKFSKNGTLLHKWGRQRKGNETLANDHLSIPHAITLIENKDMVCVADREHNRVQCYRAGLKDSKTTGQFLISISDSKLGRVYAISYNPTYDILLILDNKKGVSEGFIYSMAARKFIDAFEYPSKNGFGDGHALASAPSGIGFVVGGLSKVCPDLQFPSCFEYDETPLDRNLWRFNMYGSQDLSDLI